MIDLLWQLIRQIAQLLQRDHAAVSEWVVS